MTGAMKPESLTKSQKTGGTTYNKLDKRKKLKFNRWKCADGRPQKCYVPKEDALSSTISLKYLFYILKIDAHKGRYVAILNAPGAYLNADMPGEKSSY